MFLFLLRGCTLSLYFLFYWLLRISSLLSLGSHCTHYSSNTCTHSVKCIYIHQLTQTCTHIYMYIHIHDTPKFSLTLIATQIQKPTLESWTCSSFSCSFSKTFLLSYQKLIAKGWHSQHVGTWCHVILCHINQWRFLEPKLKEYAYYMYFVLIQLKSCQTLCTFSFSSKVCILMPSDSFIKCIKLTN